MSFLKPLLRGGASLKRGHFASALWPRDGSGTANARISASRRRTAPGRWRCPEGVDGGRKGGDAGDRILSAGRAHAATRALAHWEVASVVHKVCCHGETVKSLAEQTGEARDVW